MKSAYRAPTARKNAAKNWLFTPGVMQAYKNDLHALPEHGDRFTFTNGPYGGGRKFKVIRVMILDEGLGHVIEAQEI